MVKARPADLVRKAKRGRSLDAAELKVVGESAKSSWDYANLIKARFPEGEKTLAASSWAWEYIETFVDGRWEHEDIFFRHCRSLIVKDRKAKNCLCSECCLGTEMLMLYCKEFRGRWDKLEKMLPGMSIHACVNYHEEFMEGERWPELEKKFVTYKGRETGVWNDVNYADMLKHYILNSGWDEGRDLFLSHSDLDNCVDLFGTGRRWPGIERKFLSFDRRRDWNEFFWDGCDYWRGLRSYMKNVGPVPELEEHMLRRAGPRPLYEYAREIGRRLPAPLHQKMLLTSFKKKSRFVSRYLNYLKKREEDVRGFLKSLDSDELNEFLCGVTNPVPS